MTDTFVMDNNGGFVYIF